MKNMKRFAPASIMFVLFFSLTLVGCGGKSSEVTEQVSKETEVLNGPIVDKVIFTVSMDNTLAVKDVVEGKADVFLTAVPPAILNKLNDSDREKLEVYSIPSGSWSLLANPIPNAAPYSFKTGAGEVVFNPLAIKSVRYALNWLIDRKKIVQEILLGEGEPSFTAFTPKQPGTYRYNLIAGELGMTDSGDEAKAIADITKAMEEAAALPANKGKLVKNGKFWQYNGKDVSIKFVIRVDDPNGRLLSGRYIADQLEKAGIAVERLEWDRSKAGNVVYGGNPQDFEWSLYTEGWGAGATRRWWDIVVSQMYAPYYGYMPGGAQEGNWNYENPAIDELAKKGLNGQFLTEDEYWQDNLKATKMGLREAVRIYLAVQKDSYVANKARFNKRMLYGVGDGLNRWSLVSADVKPDTEGEFKGKKILRVIQFSSRGGLFMSPADPVGSRGFSDVFTNTVVNPSSDTANFESPADAVDTPLASMVDVSSLKTKPKLTAEKLMGGEIVVPEDAIDYDTKTKSWKKVGAGKTVSSQATGRLYPGYTWHNGQPVTLADARFARAFLLDWCTKDGDDDKYYDETLSSGNLTSLLDVKGYVYHDDGSITSYANYYFAPDRNRTAVSVGAVSVKAGNPNTQSVVPWEIYEAVSELVANGSESGTKWTVILGGGGGTEIDVFATTAVADIKAKLKDFIKEEHIPVYLKGLVTKDEALARYKASVDFIEKNGHAYISNGPFMISNIDKTTNAIISDAYRAYPFKSNYWVDKLSQKATVIDYVKVPNLPSLDQDAVFEINASEFVYPEVDFQPLANGTVEIRLQKEDGSEAVYKAVKKANGQFIATIPASDMAKLKKGTEYVVVVMSHIGEETPGIATVKLSLL